MAHLKYAVSTPIVLFSLSSFNTCYTRTHNVLVPSLCIGVSCECISAAVVVRRLLGDAQRRLERVFTRSLFILFALLCMHRQGDQTYKKTCVLCLRYGSHVFFCLFSGQIEVKNFEAQAFRVFLDWLALSLNASFRNETDFAQRAQCMCTPHVIRQVSNASVRVLFFRAAISCPHFPFLHSHTHIVETTLRRRI